VRVIDAQITVTTTDGGQLTHADTVIDLVGAIGRAVLTHLLPERRIRVKTRMIKRSNASTRRYVSA
jgi:hypothetical protein